MNIFKVLLALFLVVLAVAGAFFLFGLLAATLKLLLWLGVIALAVGVVVKLLTRGGRPRRQLSDAEFELEQTDRLIAEFRDKQLLK